MPSSVSLPAYSSAWFEARCREGECPLYPGMDEDMRMKTLKACAEMKNYDDEQKIVIKFALRCPLDKHDPL